MHQLVICVTLFVAMATASQYNCSLKCTSANEVLQTVPMRQTECYWESAPKSVADLHLDLNPYLANDDRDIFYQPTCSSGELRGTPRFEATWRAPKNVTLYEVQVHDLPLRKLKYLRENPPPLKSTCFHVEDDKQQYRSCEYTCRHIPSPSVLVRIVLNRTNSISMVESTINLHRRFQGADAYKGISLFYRRKLIPTAVSKYIQNYTLLPNPRHWATILKVANNSGEVSVTFDLATDVVKVGRYNVTLFKYNTSDPTNRVVGNIQFDEKNLTNETTGSWTFYNVSNGTYFVRVKTWSKNTPPGKCLARVKDKLVQTPTDPCFSNGKGTSDCLHVDSGLFTVTEPPTPLTSIAHTTPYKSHPTESPLSRNGLLFLIAGMVAAMAVIVIALSLLIYAKVNGHRQKGGIQSVIVIPASPSEPAVPDDSDTSKSITVFLVYSRDNRAHIHVVNKLAQLLRKVGNCSVILDMEDKDIAKYTAIEWVDAQLKDSDKVIFIKSEGALRRMLLANDKSYAKMETENLGPTFTASVHAMDVQSSHNRGNYMVVSVPYSNQKGLREDKLLTIVGNNSQFQLMTELNSLLLAIRDLSQCQAGLFRTVYAGQGEELSSTLPYIELQKAIDEAVDYHHVNPDWFQYEAELRVKKPVDDSTAVETGTERPEPEVPLTMFSGCTLPTIVQAMVAPSSQESLNQTHSDMSDNTEQVDLFEQLPCCPPDDELYYDSGFRSISQSELGSSETEPPMVTYPYFSGSEHTTDIHDLYAPESVSSSYMEDLDKQGQGLLPNGFHSFDEQEFPDHLERTDLLVG